MFAADSSLTRPGSRTRRNAWLLLSLGVLGACATTRQGIDLPNIDTWESRSAVLGEIREWEFKGRIAGPMPSSSCGIAMAGRFRLLL